MSISDGEYKSTVGLRDVHIAEVTADTALAFTAGTPEVLAPAVTMSISSTVNNKTQYADDQAYEAMTSEGESKIELEVTGLPLATRAKILGRVFDQVEGRMYDNGGTPGYFALAFRSKKTNGKYRYVQFLKGQFSLSGEEHASESDTPDPKTLKLVFTAVKTVHQFQLSGSVVDGVKGVMGDEDATGFDEEGFFEEVQTPPEASGS